MGCVIEFTPDGCVRVGAGRPPCAVANGRRYRDCASATSSFSSTPMPGAVGGMICPSSHWIGVFRISAWNPPHCSIPSIIRKFGRAGRKLDICRADDGTAKQMRSDLRVEGLGHAGDFLRFQQPADTPRFICKDRRRILSEQIGKFVLCRQSRSPVATGIDVPCRHARHACDIVGRCRFLQPERVMRFQTAVARRIAPEGVISPCVPIRISQRSPTASRMRAV